MKILKELNLNENEIKALQELKDKILERFPRAEIVLYGSKARGDSDEESDIDVLILLNGEVDDSLREKIFSLGFKIELNHDVIFGMLAESKKFWNSPRGKAMPIHTNIEKEGVPVK